MYKTLPLVLVLAGLSLAQDAREGVVEGTALGRDGEALVLGPDGSEDTFAVSPHWRGGAPRDGGGLDPDDRRRLREVPEGARVRVRWTFDERPRLVELTILSTPTEGDDGRLEGRVLRVGRTWVDVLVRDRQVRLSPHWRGGNPRDGGGLDPDILRQIRDLEPGDQVTIEWEYSERYRAVAIHLDDN